MRLLPAFDTYLLGYADRNETVPAEHAARVWPGGGWLHPVVLVDGLAAGTWRVERGEVVVEPFDALPQAGLDAEIADVAPLPQAARRRARRRRNRSARTARCSPSTASSSSIETPSSSSIRRRRRYSDWRSRCSARAATALRPPAAR